MKWNMAAEGISAVMVTIVWFYSRKGISVPSLKNRMFQGCLMVTFLSMVSNILSNWMIEYPSRVPAIAIWAVTTFYFLVTPLMGMAYYGYTAATLYEHHDGVSRVLLWGTLPSFAYSVLVLSNGWTRWLFDLGPDGSYARGPLISLTYLVFYFYCVLSVCLVVYRRSWTERSIRRILASFPIIAAAVILFQLAYPSLVLTGSAATSALLLIYLYLQNRQIDNDYLTGIPNRQAFLKMLDFTIRKSAVKPFAVVVLSLRDFRHINDEFGQRSGDAFLCAVSGYLGKVVSRHSLYRYSGDEFAILFPDFTKDEVDGTVRKLCARMEGVWETCGLSCVIRAAIGIVHYPESADNTSGLINGIDYAVARAKGNPACPVCYCGPEMLAEIKRRGEVAEILRDKLRDGGYEVYYQPIYDLNTKRFALAESLMRIPNSPIGPLFPDEFIPVAEETGTIIRLTYDILDRVCKQMNRLRAVGVEMEGIHVNFSAVQFTQNDLSRRVLEILDSNGTPHGEIKVEITESVLAENPHVVSDFAEEMHRHGILLGLDDFGTGYSNFVSVMDTPLDIIKLDKSLLWSTAENQRSALLLKNLVHMFHEMDLRVLVEGVETAEQSDFCASCKIDLIQGFYYARPMPTDEFQHFMETAARR